MTVLQQSVVRSIGPAKKVDPPGGTTGRVGCGTGVDEAPVPDANPRSERFPTRRGHPRKQTRQIKTTQPISVIAGTHAAHVVAVGVELANVAAAAIAVVVAVVAGGDGAADNRGTDETGANAPAPADRLGLCLGGGG